MKTYARPNLPKIDWHQREIGYMSLNMEEYRSLRTWVIQMEGIILKYEGQANIVNGE